MEVGTVARVRQILAGSIGNLVEWYGWYAYSAATLYFAPIFFPGGTYTDQLLQSAAVFAVGFLARPLGAWVMGLYADRVGRRAALLVSNALMCVGSLAIAVAPGAASIGEWAAVILVASRIVQGLATGGQYGASATYMSEVAGKTYRGFWSSFTYVTLIGGLLLAQLVLIILQLTLSKGAMNEWGWRVPFVVGALLAIAAYWMQARMEESHSFKKLKNDKVAPAPTAHLWTRFLRETLTVIGLSAGGNMIFYITTTYMQKYLVNTAGFSKDAGTQISAAALFVFMLAQPLAGWMSDKVGRKAMLAGAFGILALITWPVMNAIGTASTAMIAFVLIAGSLLIQSGYTSISAVVKAELFPAYARGLGVSLPYAISNCIFGGTAEYVALWFKQQGHESAFYVYTSGVLAVSFITALTMRDTKRHSLIVED
jgi:MHS family alpha-ketoglutarate permease-like MFS transporter